MNTEFYIYVKGQAVSVSKEIYLSYASMIRHERYQLDKDKQGGKMLYSNLDTPEILGEEMISSGRLSNPTEQAFFDKLLMEQLYTAIATLNDFERLLIRDLYFADKSQSQISRETGISQQLISYRTKQLLKKLRALLDEKVF